MFDPFRLLSPSPRVKRERERGGKGNERFASKDFHPTLHSSCASIPLCAKFCVSGALHFKKTLSSSWPNTGAKSDAMPPKAEAANGRIVSADDDDDDDDDDDARPIADTPRFPNRARSALVDDDAIGSPGGVCALTMMMCFCEVSFPSSLYLYKPSSSSSSSSFLFCVREKN